MDARVHQNESELRVMMNERLCAQPGEQFVSVVGREYRAQGIVITFVANSFAGRQQMQIVVAQRGNCRAAQVPHEAQGLQ